MNRALGLFDLLQSAPWPLVVLFGIVSQLGDVWFLLSLGSVLFLVGADTLGVDRRRGLFVFALGIAAVVFVEVIKAAFALPRPPGFPSGHALGERLARR
ncbi:hypothetical protein [Haloplanus halobius]|uniref:hypothetical protein n=1 Tax=Haloplanus halobius TaxID=2934938 RepID=UPI00200D6084|nr:hypothetical protein [Haloplanus sp. XH21]